MNYAKLPPGYRYAATLDFMRNRARVRSLLRLSLILLIAPFVIGLLIVPPKLTLHGIAERWHLWVAGLAMLIAYIPLHELIHGVCMYALSGVRPRYGLKLPYAYAGSTVWFDRRSHIITALAPVVFWGVALQALIALLPREWFWPLWAVQLSNLSGSAGDIYCVWLLLHMDGDLLIQDTGVRMCIMRRQPTEDETT